MSRVHHGATVRCGSPGSPTAITRASGGPRITGGRWSAGSSRRAMTSDVLTSDAHDLWYFTDRQSAPGRRARRVDGSTGPGSAGSRSGTVPFSATWARLLSYVPALADAVPGRLVHADPPRASSRCGATTTRSSRSASRTPSSPTPRFGPRQGGGAPLILTPFLHLATPGDPVNRTTPGRTRSASWPRPTPWSSRPSLEADAVRELGHPPRRGSSRSAWPSSTPR